VTYPTKTHPLRNAIKRLDGSMKDWTVLSEARDPFRLDTPSNHRDAAWLREVFERRPLPDSIHIRWCTTGSSATRNPTASRTAAPTGSG